MSRKKSGSCLALCALLLASAARAEKIRNHFDSDAAGRPPGFFDLVVWGSAGEAEWLVLGDFNPPSTPNRLIQTKEDRPAGSTAVALRRTYAFQDGELSIGLKRGAGLGGVVLRASGEKDFLLLLVDVASGDARLWSYRDAKAIELAKAKAVIDHEWGTLSVTASGPKITARWNDKPLLEATDPKPISGRIGLATMGPGAVSFDEFVFEEAPAPSR